MGKTGDDNDDDDDDNGDFNDDGDYDGDYGDDGDDDDKKPPGIFLIKIFFFFQAAVILLILVATIGNILVILSVSLLTSPGPLYAIVVLGHLDPRHVIAVISALTKYKRLNVGFRAFPEIRFFSPHRRSTLTLKFRFFIKGD